MLLSPGVRGSPSPSHFTGRSQTCDDAPDGLHQSCESGDLRLLVLPHRLPYDQPTGQAEGEVGLLGAEKAVCSDRLLGTGWRNQCAHCLQAYLSEWVIYQTFHAQVVSRVKQRPWICHGNYCRDHSNYFMQNFNKIKIQLWAMLRNTMTVLYLQKLRLSYFKTHGRSLHLWLSL